MTWQSAQRARRGVTVTVSVPMPRTVRVRPLPKGRSTPRHRGQGRSPASRFSAATSGLATTITTQGSIHARQHCLPQPTSTEAISCCRTPTLTARRHDVADQISGRRPTGVRRPPRPFDVGGSLLRRSDDADEPPWGASATRIAGDGDARGQRHPEWGSTRAPPNGDLAGDEDDATTGPPKVPPAQDAHASRTIDNPMTALRLLVVCDRDAAPGQMRPRAPGGWERADRLVIGFGPL